MITRPAHESYIAAVMVAETGHDMVRHVYRKFQVDVFNANSSLIDKLLASETESKLIKAIPWHCGGMPGSFWLQLEYRKRLG